MSTTALDLITAAFDDLGIFAPGESIPAADSQGALQRLNWMMGQWAIQTQTIPVTSREVFALVANQQDYTIGPGGNFNTTRPASLLGAGLLLNSSTPVVEIPRGILTDDGWQAIQVKGLTSTLFTVVYYNPTFETAGLGTITLWPIPNTSQNSLVLYRQDQLSEFATLQTAYELPNGYPEALQYQLELRLARPYGKQVPPDLYEQAARSFGVIKRANLKLTDLPQDPAITRDQRGGYNILTGTGG